MVTVKELKDILATAVDTDLVIFSFGNLDELGNTSWAIDEIKQVPGFFILISEE